MYIYGGGVYLANIDIVDGTTLDQILELLMSHGVKATLSRNLIDFQINAPKLLIKGTIISYYNHI